LLTLLSERFAPITESFGFLEVPLNEAVQALGDWRKRLYRAVTVTPLSAGFPESLRALEPLVAGTRPREMLVSAGKWTVYFDCGANGTDAVSVVGNLSRLLKCQAVLVTSKPDIRYVPGVTPGRSGHVLWELLGPIETDFLNYVRSVGVTFDEGRWRFDASGTVQDFEDTQAYASRRIRDRFNSEMLERYCQEMGIDVFNPDIYGPECVLFESVLNVESKSRRETIAEAQARLGIVPVAADSLSG
jgi:hypothetical protein